MHRSVTQRALMDVDDQYPRLAVFRSTDPISYRFAENRWGDPEVNGLPSWRGANWRFGVFIPLPSKTFLNLYLSQLISYVTVNPKFANLLLHCHRMCLPFHSGHSERLRQYGNRRWSTFVDFHLEPYHEWTGPRAFACHGLLQVTIPWLSYTAQFEIRYIPKLSRINSGILTWNTLI